MLVGSATDWKLVDAGDGFTCAIKNEGSLWCFANYRGQPVSAMRQALSGQPLQIGTETDWVTVSTGAAHACALRADGRVACIDKKRVANAEKFGHDVTDDAVEPVSALTDVRAIAAGRETSCGVTATGELWCWGRVGSKLASPPVQIGGRTDWKHIEMSAYRGCAARTDGKVYCWVKDVRDIAPTNIAARPDAATSLTVGNSHDCAFTESGWQCWGGFEAGQRGPDADEETASPAPKFDDWTQISAGGRHTCGLRDGRAWCWGENSTGQLGNGIDGGSRSRPAPLDTEVRFRTISSSVYHACGLTDAGALYCWGANLRGQLGSESSSDAARPTPVSSDATWTDVSVHSQDTCAVREDGTLWCWGLSHGRSPRQVSEAKTWRDVETASKKCATRTDGSLWCWLDGRKRPPSKMGDGWSGRFSVGYRSVCGLRSDRSVECIQLRPTPKGPNARPFQLVAGEWKDFDVVDSMACGIRDDGKAWCLEGFDGKRPSSLYSGGPRPVPLDPSDPDAKWESVSASSSHGCAIRSDRSLWCWGSSRSGALGLGPDVTRAKTPKKVGDGWSYVSAGEETTCGITEKGRAHCWGRLYVIGDGKWLQPSPQPVVSPAGASIRWTAP